MLNKCNIQHNCQRYAMIRFLCSAIAERIIIITIIITIVIIIILRLICLPTWKIDWNEGAGVQVPFDCWAHPRLQNPSCPHFHIHD